MFVGLVGLFIASLVLIGPEQLISGVQQEAPGLHTFIGPAGVWTPVYTLTFAVVFIFGVTAYPHVYQRFLAAGSNDILRRSSLLYPALGTITFFVATALGVWSKAVIPNPENPDYIIPLMVQELTGPIITGFIIAAGVAALMSTADSVVLSLSSMITHDVYRRRINPDASDEQEVLVAQGLLIVVVVVALALALTRPASIFDLGSFGVVGHAAAVPALYLSLYWRRSSSVAAVVSMVVSAALMIGFFLEWLPGGTQPWGMHYGFVGMVVSFVLYVGIAYVMDESTDADAPDFVSS
jgi:SSS family solute:Na+ symporter